MEQIKTLIIGSGPAGYTAAIYAGRAGLNPVLYSGIQPGGQLTTTTIVENFPGYPQGVDGTQMMMELQEQAARFGAVIRDGSIVKADLSNRPFHIVDERGNEVQAQNISVFLMRRNIKVKVLVHVPHVTVSSIVSVLWLLLVVVILHVKRQCIFLLLPQKFI